MYVIYEQNYCNYNHYNIQENNHKLVFFYINCILKKKSKLLTISNLKFKQKYSSIF